MDTFRIERDSMGEVRVPRDAYFGAQTLRAVDNFRISGRSLPRSLIHALGRVKAAAAVVNRDLKLLPPDVADLIHRAAREVAEGKFDDQFPVDVFQTGSGTSSNMNANEVIANRAIELSGGDRFAAAKAVHPNDHVNLSQSSNDVFPTAIHVAVGVAIQQDLIPALESFQRVLEEKARQWDAIIKIGRTHLADATPIRLGQEFSGFARQLELSVQRAKRALQAVGELPAGGTAVGTGINTHPEFGARLAARLAEETGLSFVEAGNHFEANANRDGLVECSGLLRTVAVSLFTVANNVRWLGSGPRCGFYEVILPDLQPGSSIMPGKINPVACESLMQATARVVGNDQTVAFSGATGSQFQLSTMMPVMADAVLESVTLLAAGSRSFVELCATGLKANADQCTRAVEQSLAMATGLNPLIGYDAAAVVAKEAFASGRTVRDVALEGIRQGTLRKIGGGPLLTEEELTAALNPRAMTEPKQP